MIKILKTLIFGILFVSVPIYSFAHVNSVSNQTESAQLNFITSENIGTADLSSFRNCNGNQSCEIIRKQIIEILEDLIRELLIEIKKEQEIIALEEDEQIDEDEGVAEDEEDRIEYASRLSEKPLRKGRTKSFRVQNGKAEFRDGEHPVYRELWKLVTESFPLEYRDRLRYFKLINKPEIGNAAYVEISAKKRNDDLTVYFDLVLNLDDVKVGSFSQQQRSMDVIIHELGHVIAFGEDQMDYFVDDCDNFQAEDINACSKDGSYYTYFYDEFWDDEFYENSEEFMDDEDYEIVENFYGDNKDDFVSVYSASSPDEDLAESMLYFFTEPRELDESTEKNQKINSFYKFPEMIEIRNYIQRNLFYLLS